MNPRLLRSPFTHKVYVVTLYQDLGEGKFIAKTKYDVTEDFGKLLDLDYKWRK